MIEERVICSVVDGQAVLQQHPATNSQNYQGLKIVHGDVYSFSQNLKFGQNGWAQIGDRFQKKYGIGSKNRAIKSNWVIFKYDKRNYFSVILFTNYKKFFYCLHEACTYFI